jgi:hypothetical protein
MARRLGSKYSSTLRNTAFRSNSQFQNFRVQRGSRYSFTLSEAQLLGISPRRKFTAVPSSTCTKWAFSTVATSSPISWSRKQRAVINAIPCTVASVPRGTTKLRLPAIRSTSPPPLLLQRLLPKNCAAVLSKRSGKIWCRRHMGEHMASHSGPLIGPNANQAFCFPLAF